jgi:hypothetical protein
MISNGAISTLQNHIPFLTFAVIAIRAVRGPLVRIAVLNSRWAGEDKNKPVLRGCAYTTLPLSSKFFMNILSAIVCSTNYKSPHCSLPRDPAKSNLDSCLCLNQNNPASRRRRWQASPTGFRSNSGLPKGDVAEVPNVAATSASPRLIM